jgi:hypothetical protein
MKRRSTPKVKIFDDHHFYCVNHLKTEVGLVHKAHSHGLSQSEKNVYEVDQRLLKSIETIEMRRAHATDSK